MNIKDIMQKSVALSMCFLVAYYIIFGPKGVHEYIKLTLNINKQKKIITQLQQDIDYLHTATTQWQNNPFIAQHAARYDLGLGYTNELVYLLSSRKRPKGAA